MAENCLEILTITKLINKFPALTERKVYYFVHNNQPLDPIISLLGPINITSCCSYPRLDFPSLGIFQ